MSGIRIDEIPFDNQLSGIYDLVHVYKRQADGSFSSKRAPLSAIAAEGPQGIEGIQGVRGIDGNNGEYVAQLQIYRRIPADYTQEQINALTPGTGNIGDGSFSFATLQFDISDITGWSKTIPTGTDPLYISLGIASGVKQVNRNEEGVTIGTTQVDNDIVWSPPELANSEGPAGQDGRSTAQLAIFTRRATQPPVPKGGYVDFGNNELVPPGPANAPQNGTPSSDPNNPSYTFYNKDVVDGVTIDVPGRDDVQWYATDGEATDALGTDLQLWNCTHTFSITGDTGNDPIDAPYGANGVLNNTQLDDPNWGKVNRGPADGLDAKSTYIVTLFHRGNAVTESTGSDGLPNGIGTVRPIGGSYDFTNNRMTVRDSSNGGAFGNSDGAVVAVADGDHLVDGNGATVTGRYIDMPSGAGFNSGTWTEEVPPEQEGGSRLPLWRTQAVASTIGLLGQDTSLTFTYPKLISIPAVDGDPGEVTAQVNIYIRATSAPTKPTTGTFDFDTGLLSVVPNGWKTTPFKGDGTGQLYAVTGFASAIYNKDRSPTPGYPDAVCTGDPGQDKLIWSDVVESSEDGVDGSSQMLAQAFTRSDLDLTSDVNYKPVGGAVSFPSGTLTPPTDASGSNLTWTAEIPAGLSKIYVCQKLFSIIGNTGNDDNTVSGEAWSQPRLLAQDGTAGVNAVNNSRVPIYYGSSTKLNNPPSVPTVAISVDLDSSSAAFGTIIYSKADGVQKYDISNTNILDGTGSNTGWVTEMPDQDYIYVAHATAADSDETNVDAISTNEWTDVVLFKQRGDDGLVGYGNAIVELYKRTNSNTIGSEADHTGTLKYYFNDVVDGAVTHIAGSVIPDAGTNMNGWLSAIPTFQNSSDHYLWVKRATASSRADFDSIPATEFNIPTIHSQNPFDVTDTIVSHIIAAYKRSSSDLAANDKPGTVTVRLSGETQAGVIQETTLANGWSKTPPTGTDPLYVCKATASGVVNLNGNGLDTDTVDDNEWSEPVIFGATGIQGEKGPDGNVVKTISLYKRTGFHPGTVNPPTSNGTYDFNANTWTFETPGDSDGWSFTVPTKQISDKLLWQTFTTVTSSFTNGATDTVNGYSSEADPGEWGDAQAINADGESVVFRGSFANLAAFIAAESPVNAGEAYHDETDKKSYIFVRKDGTFSEANDVDTGDSNDGVLTRIIFAEQGQTGDPGVSINYRGPFPNDAAVTNPQLNDVYRNTSSSPPVLRIYNGSSFADFIQDGDPGAGISVTGVTRVTDKSSVNYGKVTIEFLRDGADPTQTISKVFDTKGIGIGDISFDPDVTNDAGASVTRVTVKSDHDNPIVLNTFDVPNGVDALPAGVAIIFASNDSGANASYTIDGSSENGGVPDNITREFIRYEEYTGVTAPTVEEFSLANGVRYQVGSFVKFIGTDGTNILPVYTTVANPTLASQCTLDPQNQTHVSFFEISTPGTPAEKFGTLTDQKIAAATFVKYVGSDGTSVSIKGTLSSESDLSTISSPTEGDGYIIGVNLYVYTGTNLNVLSGFTNVGQIKGDNGNPGASVTPVYASDANGTGAGLTLESTDTHVFFYVGSSLTGATSAAALAEINNLTYTKFEGPVGFDDITIGQQSISGTSRTYAITFTRNNGTVATDTFVVEDGASVTGQTVTTVTDSNGVEIGTRVQFLSGVEGQSESRNFGDPFTIARGLPAPQRGVKVVYATSTGGANPSYTIQTTDNGVTTTREFVAYIEWDTTEPASAQAAKDAYTGTFVKFIGEDGNPANITAVYATDSNGSFASKSNATVNGLERVFVTFIEQELVNDTAVTNFLTSNPQTFVNIKGVQGDGLVLAYNSNSRDSDISAFSIVQDENNNYVNGWSPDSSPTSVWRAEKIANTSTWKITLIQGEKGDQGDRGVDGRPRGFNGVRNYSNPDDKSIYYNPSTERTVLSSFNKGDTGLGIVYPAFDVSGYHADKKKVAFDIPIKLVSPAGGNPAARLYIRVNEYDSDLPDGKTHVGNDDTDTYLAGTFNDFTFASDVNERFVAYSNANFPGIVHTVSQDTGIFYSTGGSMKLQSTYSSSEIGGSNGSDFTTKGVYMPIDSVDSTGGGFYSGQAGTPAYVTIRFRVHVPSTNAATKILYAYSTNQNGNSGWYEEDLSSLDSTNSSGSLRWYQFKRTYQLPSASTSTDDYVGFAGDGSNGIVYIDDLDIFKSDASGNPIPGPDRNHPAVQPRTRQIYRTDDYYQSPDTTTAGWINRKNSDPSINDTYFEPYTRAFERILISNTPGYDSGTTYSFEYKPTSTAKYASIQILNWQLEEDRPAPWANLSTSQKTQQTDKALLIGPVDGNIIYQGSTGDAGAHGLTPATFEFYKQVKTTDQIPNYDVNLQRGNFTGTGNYNILNKTFTFNSGQNPGPNAWTSLRPAPAPGMKIYSVNGSVQYAANLEGTDTDVEFQGNWGDVTAIDETLPRTAPITSVTAKYNRLNANFTGVKGNNSNRAGQYSFRRKSDGSDVVENVHDGYGSTASNPIGGNGAVAINDSTNGIGQIVFANLDTDGTDTSEFLENIDNSLQILWKYGDKWIIFKRVSNVDNVGNYRVLDVEVEDFSENIATLSDLPFGYDNGNPSNLANLPTADVIFGYTPAVRNAEVFLYKRSGPSAPNPPTGSITYKFSNGNIIEGTANLNGWSRTAPADSTDGKYLWRIQATASNSTDSDVILNTEWSTAELIAQDGITPAAPGAIVSFTKELFTRTDALDSAWVVTQDNGWTNGSYKPTDNLPVGIRASGSTNPNEIVLDSNNNKHGTNSDGIKYVESSSNVTATGKPVRWHNTIPSADDPDHGGKFLYVISATVYDNTGGTANENNSVNIAQSSWTAPVKLTQNGTGLNVNTVRVYARTSGTAPAAQNGSQVGFNADSSYDFDLNVLTIPSGANNPKGWTTDIPESGGSHLWVSRATASSTGRFDSSIKKTEWGPAERLSSDGTALIFLQTFAGSDGTHGSSRQEFKDFIIANYGGIIPANSYFVERDADNPNRMRSVLFTGYFTNTVSSTNANEGDIKVKGDSSTEITSSTSPSIADQANNFTNATFRVLTIDGDKGPSGDSIRLRTPSNTGGGIVGNPTGNNFGGNDTVTTFPGGTFTLRTTQDDADGDGFWDTTATISSPKKNDIARVGLEGRIFIYDGSAWALLTRDGKAGAGGADGPSGLAVFITYNDNGITDDQKPTPPPATNNGNYNVQGADAWNTNPDSFSGGSQTVNWMSQKLAIPDPNTGFPTGEVPWDPPILIAGEAGLPGKRTAFLEVYIRSTTQPTIGSPGQGTTQNKAMYDFTTDKLIPPQINNFDETAKFATDSNGRQLYQQHRYFFRSQGATRDKDQQNPDVFYAPNGQVNNPGQWRPARYYSKENGGTHEPGSNYIEIPETLLDASLYRSTALASTDVGATGASAIDKSIKWTYPQKITVGKSDIDDIDIDLVLGAVEGRGLRKIVTTTTRGNIITQAAYQALATNTNKVKNGWNEGDTVEDDTVYLVF